MRVRTYIDAGVLIAAARATPPLAAKAWAVLDDASRDFVSSDYVRMEVLPKPTFHGRVQEVAFYEEFLRTAVHVVPFDVSHMRLAMAQACEFGLSAFDALHAVAAQAAHCEELVTSERPSSPLCRLQALRVVSIHTLAIS